jgi:PKD repeat protein
MTAVAQLAVEVTSQTTSSQDVTEEYVDLTSKLKNLEATEQQLLRIMDKAEKVEDILAVERELSNTRSQIEQTKGRMQYLEKTASMSLIQVNLEQSKLDAKLTADRRFIKSGESIQFAAQVAGGFTPYSYQWDFGDGKTSNDAAPAHTYRAAGDYTVSLTVTDDRGNTATAETRDYVTVQSGWRAGNVAGSAWNGLAAFGRTMLSIAIWLGIFSPVWLIAGGIVFWQLRRRRKTR